MLRRIPEKMDPSLYYKTFRPTFDSLRRWCTRGQYAGGGPPRRDRRPEQRHSALVAFLKIPHKPTRLTDHLEDMRPVHAGGTSELSSGGSKPCPQSVSGVDSTLFNEAAGGVGGIPRDAFKVCSRVHCTLGG